MRTYKVTIQPKRLNWRKNPDYDKNYYFDSARKQWFVDGKPWDSPGGFPGYPARQSVGSSPVSERASKGRTDGDESTVVALANPNGKTTGPGWGSFLGPIGRGAIRPFGVKSSDVTTITDKNGIEHHSWPDAGRPLNAGAMLGLGHNEPSLVTEPCPNCRKPVTTSAFMTIGYFPFCGGECHDTFYQVEQSPDPLPDIDPATPQNIALGCNSKLAVDQEWVDGFQRKYLLESSPHEQAELIAQFPHLAKLPNPPYEAMP